MTMPWQGRRVVLAAFCCQGFEDLCDSEAWSLRALGFKASGEDRDVPCGSGDSSALEDTEGTLDEEGSERVAKFRSEDCGNSGPPLSLEWDGQLEPVSDGFGLCSPTRWPPEARGTRLSERAKGFSRAMFNVLKSFVEQVIPDPKRTAFELALGRLQSSPFSLEQLRGLRAEWFQCIETFLGGGCSWAGEVADSQPFFLRAISEAVACQEDSYVTGVSIGYDRPVEHLPKVKSRKLDDSVPRQLLFCQEDCGAAGGEIQAGGGLRANGAYHSGGAAEIS